MSQNIEEVNINTPEANDDEVNLLEFLLIIIKYKKLIFLTCFVTFIVTCGLTLLMPNIYTSTTRILPSQDSQGSFSSMLGGMSGLAALAGISVGGGSGELYAGMLKSRSIADAIIDKFNLMEVYGQEYRIKTYEALNNAVDISVGKKDQIVSISVDDEDPVRAAAIANTYVEELKKLNINLNLNSAGKEKQFLEERISVVKDKLTQAEDLLREFQEKNKAIRIDAQAGAIIDAIARLKGELASKEVELGILLSSKTEQNPEVRGLREGITQIKNQISQLENSHEGKGVSGDIFFPTSEVPELGVQYARLLREFKVQETLYELLTKQYELAKLSEAKNTSTIQVLDLATPSDKKNKPKRSLIVLIVTFIAGMCAIFWTVMLEAAKSASEENLELLAQIKAHLRLTKLK